MAERTNEEALDLFADLLEPAAEILSDPELSKTLQSSGKAVKAVQLAIKNHKEAVIQILARIDGVNPADYKVNALTLPIKLINLLNRPEVKELFTSQGQNGGNVSSGSATESIKGGAN